MFFRKPERRNETPAAPSPPSPASTPASAPVAAQKAGAELSPEEAKRRQQLAKQVAASFGEVVMLLMRSPIERQHTLADLEWLAAPAVMSGQFAVAEAQAKETGVITPVGALLWAFVSPEIDSRLSDVSKPVKLQPNEWRSGDIPWIVLALGDQRVVASLLDKVKDAAFKGKAPKMRLRGPDGKVTVGVVDVRQAASPA